MNVDYNTGEILTPDEGTEVPGKAVYDELPSADLPDIGEEVLQNEAEGLDFYLSASDVAALMTERLVKKTTTATFRRMVLNEDAPAPAGQDGKTVKWSQTAIDTWLDRLEATARQERADSDTDASPDGKDFYLSASEAAALVSEEIGERITVAGFRRMVMTGQAPEAMLQAGGTSKWSQQALDAWLQDSTNTPEAGAEAEEPEGAAPEEEVPQPKHVSVFEFFEKTYSAYYELYDGRLAVLQQNGKPVMVWCQHWWLHKSVLGRVTAAWYAWEDSFTSGGGAMSSWILEHADRHFDRIMAEDGPFRKCKTEHTDDLLEYPTEPCPDALLLTLDEPDTTNQHQQ
jgi:predicted DNA-binding transcriptional regulator AlpA